MGMGKVAPAPVSVTVPAAAPALFFIAPGVLPPPSPPPQAPMESASTASQIGFVIFDSPRFSKIGLLDSA
jgi:hypothetical protein